MKAPISSDYHTPADAAGAAVKKSKTLLHVRKGFPGFKGSVNFPEEWTICLFPGWLHQFYFTKINNEKCEQSAEDCSGLTSQWNHLIKAEPINSAHCKHNDEIEIQAGLFYFVCLAVCYRILSLE